MVRGRRRGRAAALVTITGVATVFGIACGGRIDTSGALTGASGAGSEPSAAYSPVPPPPYPPYPPGIPPRPPPPDPPRPPSTDGGGGGDCAWLGARCQIFEPGGPERWGCHTVGTEPELACEHAAGALVARCNCSGAFGDGAQVAWFEVPATSTMFTEAEIVRLWEERCDGRCVARPPAPPPPLPDGG